MCNYSSGALFFILMIRSPLVVRVVRLAIAVEGDRAVTEVGSRGVVAPAVSVKHF